MPVTLTGALITSYSSFNIYYWTETTLVPDKLTVSDLSKLKDQKYVYTVKTGDKLGSTLTYIKTALPNNREYRYVITAVAAAGNTESLFGSQISAFPEAKTPAAPSGLSATSGTQKVTLAWTPDTDKTISYKVYFSNRIPAKSEDLVTDANLISPTINGTYSHTGLTFGTTYYYVVTSVADNESVPSAIVAVTM
jgi:predicted phage tail protein